MHELRGEPEPSLEDQIERISPWICCSLKDTSIILCRSSKSGAAKTGKLCCIRRMGYSGHRLRHRARNQVAEVRPGRLPTTSEISS